MACLRSNSFDCHAAVFLIRHSACAHFLRSFLLSFPPNIICAPKRFGTFTVWVHEVNTKPKHVNHAVDGPGTERYDTRGATCSVSGWTLDTTLKNHKDAVQAQRGYYVNQCDNNSSSHGMSETSAHREDTGVDHLILYSIDVELWNRPAHV